VKASIQFYHAQYRNGVFPFDDKGENTGHTSAASLSRPASATRSANTIGSSQSKRTARRCRDLQLVRSCALKKRGRAWAALGGIARQKRRPWPIGCSGSSAVNFSMVTRGDYLTLIIALIRLRVHSAVQGGRTTLQQMPHPRSPTRSQSTAATRPFRPKTTTAPMRASRSRRQGPPYSTCGNSMECVQWGYGDYQTKQTQQVWALEREQFDQ
jgi:hypothetical protein